MYPLGFGSITERAPGRKPVWLCNRRRCIAEMWCVPQTVRKCLPACLLSKKLQTIVQLCAALRVPVDRPTVGKRERTDTSQTN